MRSAVLALALLVPASPAYAEGWAVFNLQQAMEKTKHFKEAQAALEKELKSSTSALEKKQAGLDKRRESLEAKRSMAAGKALAEEEQALVKDEQALAQAARQARRELGAFEQKLKGQIFQRMDLAVQQIAAQGDYDFIVEASKSLYHKPAIDITKKVLKVYRAKFGDKPLDMSKAQLSQRGPGPRGGPGK